MVEEKKGEGFVIKDKRFSEDKENKEEPKQTKETASKEDVKADPDEPL